MGMKVEAMIRLAATIGLLCGSAGAEEVPPGATDIGCVGRRRAYDIMGSNR